MAESGFTTINLDSKKDFFDASPYVALQEFMMDLAQQHGRTTPTLRSPSLLGRVHRNRRRSRPGRGPCPRDHWLAVKGLALQEYERQSSCVKQRRVTMADVAAKMGVSKIAVSMALRNSYEISLKRRREIQRVAKQMGYVPDPFLSALAAHRRQRVVAKDHGVLAWINHWRDPAKLKHYKEFEMYWRGAVQAAARFGYRLDEVLWEGDCSPKRLEKILLARGIDGILIPPHNELLDWGDFDWNKFSVVRFGLSVPSPDSNLVTSDVFRATVMAVTKIHSYGYRRIGVTVNEEFNERVGGNLLSGFYYVQSVLDLKPALPPLLTILKTRTPDELMRQKVALEQWLLKQKPDAVLTSDIEVPGMIRELGYRVPKDIAIAGSSVVDIPGVDAGIDQHSEAIGRAATEMLLKQMNVNERGEPRYPCRILVESRWKDGSSLPRKG